jgi:hypothetical protein
MTNRHHRLTDPPQHLIGFLSHVAPDADVSTKPEDGNETFYGTAIAAHDVSAYEMGEDEVSYQFSSIRLSRLNTNVMQIPARNAYRYIKDEREFQLSMPCCGRYSNANIVYVVLMDGTPALNVASFVTTYMWVFLARAPRHKHILTMPREDEAETLYVIVTFLSSFQISFFTQHVRELI